MRARPKLELPLLISDSSQKHDFGEKLKEILLTTYFITISTNKVREKSFMTWDLRNGRNNVSYKNHVFVSCLTEGMVILV